MRVGHCVAVLASLHTLAVSVRSPFILAFFALAVSLLFSGSASQADEPDVVRLTVEPNRATLRGALERVQFTVTLVAKDGAERDVTREAEFELPDANVIQIDSTGLVRPIGDGAADVRVTYNQLEVVARLDVAAFGQQESAIGQQDSAADASSRAHVSFQDHVIPVLSRSGCNSGACHAAQYGQGGFKLSLLGFAPEQDYPAIVREREQRRVSLVQPEDSLILRKATRSEPHGGGQRFSVGSYEYEVLRAWLRSGAASIAADEPDVVGLEVSPISRTYHVGDTRQLRVVAVYGDGSRRDVTRRAMYDSLNEGVVKVDGGGYLLAQAGGQGPVMIRYRGQAKISMAIVPFADGVDLSSFQPANFVDRLVMKRWRQLGLAPSEVCSDEVFVRRAFLDAIGTLPTPARVQAFLASEAEDKRERLVDELLGLTGDPARDVYVNSWSAYWTLKWGDLIRNNRNKLGDGGMWALFNWVRGSFRENKPFDQFVRELITAQGSVFENGPANYYKITTKPDELAEATAQNFLGVRLQCAKCHHHPFEVYSQADYYGLAAFFTRVGTKASSEFGALGGDTVVLVKSSGSIRHPRTRKTVRPTPLLGEPIDESKYRDLRRALAEWLTSPDNKLFARNVVNRFWGYLMGTGLVEPVDDMRVTNPPSNPELLDALAREFVEQGFDLRRLMRVVMTSRVYQLSSRTTPDNVADTRFYTHYNVKRLPAEVLLDALDFATGTRQKFTGIPAGTRAIELPDPNYASYFLDTMGRPKRVVTCECERTTQPNLAQVLHLANGDVLSGKLADKKGRVARLVAQHKDDAPIIDELYMSTFSRMPGDAERMSAIGVITAAPNRKEGVEDLLWALCNSREFLFNH